MSERNSSSKSARSVLLEDFNDIDVYVEDTSIETNKLYTIILNRATNSKYNLSSVLPVGNSKSVIEEWKKHKKKSDGRKKIFIVDGDFYIINDNIHHVIDDPSISDLNGLFILPKYCIENFLIEENAIVSVVDDDEPKQNYKEILQNLAFNDWRGENENHLINLFIIYSIIIKYNLGIQNVQYGVNKLCKDATGIVCNLKIEERIEKLKEEISQLSSINIENEILIRREKVEKSPDKLLTYVSGKDYLLPLLKTRIKSLNKFNPENVSFKIRLAKKCSFSDLTNIYDHLIG